MKNIFVINSPIFDSPNPQNQEDYLPPLGLGLIVLAIDNSRYKVTFIDALGENLGIKQILKKIEKEHPDIVCTNIFTTNYNLVKTIVEKTDTGIYWIIGGISTKSLYQEIFKWQTKSPIDIIYGDGEKIIEDAVTMHIDQECTDQIGNKRFFIVDHQSNYFVTDISSEYLKREIFSFEPQKNIYGEVEICIYTSRGCPNNCAYCVAAHDRNKELGKIRFKSKERIISELNWIKEKHPQVEAIRILDDLFLANRRCFERAISVFSHYSYRWRAMCHIQPVSAITDEVLLQLKRSGCNELFIGIESGSPQILYKIHKTHDLYLIQE